MLVEIQIYTTCFDGESKTERFKCLVVVSLVRQQHKSLLAENFINRLLLRIATNLVEHGFPFANKHYAGK